MRLIVRARIAAAVTTATTLAASTFAGAPAQALPTARWTQLTTSHRLTSATEGRLIRFGGKLQVFWTQTDAPRTQSTQVRPISSAGKLGRMRTVIGGWSVLIDEPTPIIENGQLLLAFGGIRSNDPYDKYSGAMAYATSPDGVTWTLGEGLLSEHRNYLGYGTGAVDDQGTPFVAFVPTSVARVSLHRGIDLPKLLPQPDTYSSATPGGVADVNLARDSRTGDIWAAWYSLGNGAADVYYQKVYPTLGKLTKLDGAAQPYQQIAMASRIGGGVYIGYTVGRPAATKVRLVRAGSRQHLDLNAGAGNLALAAGTDGRIWLSWRQDYGANLKVVRTNTTATEFGKVVSVAGPTTYGIGHIAANGSAGPLDVVVSAVTGPLAASYVALFHTHVLAPLTLTLSTRSLRSGRFVATVTDAGAPVAGATVRFAGKVFLTGRGGKVSLTVPAAARGRRTVTASRAMYSPATATLVVG